ncbi:MAG: alpha/beta hydrolase [Bacteroidota bacterium]
MRALLLALLLPLTGCTAVEGLALSFVYQPQDLPSRNVTDDIVYVEGSDDPKHTLDVFRPLTKEVRQRPWPTVVYVHGGGWVEGDKDLTFGGQDIYGNIGRYFAGRGIGAATVNYRLQPGATWREQVSDVARAVAEVRRQVQASGGDPNGLVLMGHSAGGHLIGRVALDRATQEAAGLPPEAICGAIPVSAAALDLRDRESFVIADNYPYYRTRFAPPGTPEAETAPLAPEPWQGEASVAPLLSPEAPPFLVLYAEGDYPALIRQNEVFADALEASGVPHEVVIVPGSSHERILGALSQDDYVAGPAMLDFVRGLSCGG